MEQKLASMLGGDYIIGQRLNSVPDSTGFLIVAPQGETLWFANYYLAPKKAYYYEQVTTEADLAKVSADWLKSRNIKHVLLYHLPSVRLLDIGK